MQMSNACPAGKAPFVLRYRLAAENNVATCMLHKCRGHKKRNSIIEQTGTDNIYDTALAVYYVLLGLPVHVI